MKVYIVCNYDGNVGVFFEESAALKKYKEIEFQDNGAAIQVWLNNQLLMQDSIYDKI
ncbi:hypothetical protein B8V81_5052 [Paenibacillus pasadenensis]|uniref:Uncharacterized protein n=1 Tax=Paenibacillus pasadenensis TaxID=217090 RepID=A0A2N5MZM7_9BACL|nr:hypothetical protein [Paenibacillus pasadenensis]PLT43512.1 hypothetical protein B8V81_5052 [Paenibacillus pasadenensis]